MRVLLHLDPHEPSRLVGLWVPRRADEPSLESFYPPGAEAERADAMVTLSEKVDEVPWESYFQQLARRMPYGIWWEATDVDAVDDLEELFVVLAAQVLSSAAAIHGAVSTDTKGELTFAVKMFSSAEAQRLGLGELAMFAPLDEALLRMHHVWVRSDNPFQQRARLLQSLWREAAHLDMGTVMNAPGGDPLGSELKMPDAEQLLTNYLTETTRKRVRRELFAPDRDRSRLFGEPRIFSNLLSSQPLTFNLFAELDADRALASRVFSDLLPGVVDEVDHIEFEYSPGRRSPRYLGNRSAFDAFVVHTTPAGGWGFIGIEVKYHENLKTKAASMEGRPYEKVAKRSKAFDMTSLDRLGRPPLQQIWLDHLLALSMLEAKDGWETGRFVFLYPQMNHQCATAVADYSACLADPSTFQAWNLEILQARVAAHSNAPWVQQFYDRYLNFECIDQLDGAR